MRTHQLAGALSQLADILKKSPDFDLKDFSFANREPTPFLVEGKFRPERTGGALTVLVALSKINKQHWIELIQAFNWPLTIDKRDSSRNIVGKVLNFLQQNPQASDRLKKSTSRDTSPALMKALQALLEDNEPSR